MQSGCDAHPCSTHATSLQGKHLNSAAQIDHGCAVHLQYAAQ